MCSVAFERIRLVCTARVVRFGKSVGGACGFARTNDRLGDEEVFSPGHGPGGANPFTGPSNGPFTGPSAVRSRGSLTRPAAPGGAGPDRGAGPLAWRAAIVIGPPHRRTHTARVPRGGS